MTVKGKPARIYDNCLRFDIFWKMQNALLGVDIPWYYNDEVSNQEVKTPIEGYEERENVAYQFIHRFYDNANGFEPWSDYTFHLAPILNIINPRAWMRVKANLGTRVSEQEVGGWHYDIYNYEEDNITPKPYIDSIISIFYLNTNNGYTMLETGDKIESVENRLLLFPNDTLHTSVRQTDTKVRVVINFDFFHNY